MLARRASPVEARSPMPSPARRREARELEPSAKPLRKRKQHILNEQELISEYLCPRPLALCPVSPQASPKTVLEWIREGFECVDQDEDLTSCGGCGINDAK